MWKVATTGSYDGWFADLDETAQVEVIAKVEHADTLNGSKHANMKELRASTRDKVIRIAFAFDPNRSAILLVAGDKGGVSEKRFYKELIVKADALFEAHLAKLKAKPKAKPNDKEK